MHGLQKVIVIWMQKHMNVTNVQEMVVDLIQYIQVYVHILQHHAVDYVVHDDRFQCTGNNDNLKPSTGLKHQFCVCYNPTNNGLYNSIIMDINTYNTQIISDINIER